MNPYSKENSNNKSIQKTKDKLEKYHYNAYKNLVKTSFFLNAAGITAVMASFAIKYKDLPVSEKLVKNFINSNHPFDRALNSSLDYFLISVLLMIICVVVEYVSYFPRREIQNNHIDCNAGFCNDLIRIFKIIMYFSLMFSFISLLVGGLAFRNISFNY